MYTAQNPAFTTLSLNGVEAAIADALELARTEWREGNDALKHILALITEEKDRVSSAYRAACRKPGCRHALIERLGARLAVLRGYFKSTIAALRAGLELLA